MVSVHFVETDPPRAWEREIECEKLAVISCIHGNLAALDAVVEDIERSGIKRIVCLGDLVGYGPQPNEVVERVRTLDMLVVQGCWDEGIANEQGDCGCAFATREDAELGELAFTWTDLNINAETRAYLEGLPFMLRSTAAAGKLVFCHGSPASSAEYLQSDTHDLVLLERASRVECDFLLCGHTHIPFVRRLAGALVVELDGGLDQDSPTQASYRTLRLQPKTIVNVGSVGEPRHGRPEATYAILDQTSGQVWLRSVSYDFSPTLDALERAGLPPIFAQRLQGGVEWVHKRKTIECFC